MSGGTVPNLLPFFSTKVYSGYSDTWKGFYKVYSDVFNSVYLNEVNFARKLGLGMETPPVMGSLESPYAQVKEFYSYWLGFRTVMDFCWVDEFDVMAEPDGVIRRKMKEENDEVRKKAKREYNESVRSLAAFVKKLDKRMVDMMVMKRIEMEVKERERERKEKMGKVRWERAMNYKEPDWAKGEDGGFSVVEEDDSDDNDDEGMVLYCIVCSKNFKTEKQWKNHEQSKKHKEIVAELRVEAPETETVEELQEKIQDGFNIDEAEAEQKDVEEEVVGEADETDDEFVMTEEDVKGSSESEDDDADDEMSLLKKMVSEQKNKLKNVVSREEDEVVVEIERTKQNADDANIVELNTYDNVKDDAHSMEYDNKKITGRRRRSKKDKDMNNLGGLLEKSSEADNTQDRNGDTEEFHAETFEESKRVPRSKTSTRGMTSEGTSKKVFYNKCGRCGEKFESRTKLFKHLADTDHATVKSR
ncbi:hypothetical protein HID58_026971 [Brassica napus]|uniref:C2H2-type domain-containing protein n=1 Tax=Brassica napus TaxID=3708 RepID=A0ABQ8CSP4_BRANA|nr:DNAJ protein JJJ1 homolog [Brassica napus]KAH0919311.1 hypothetical protein HID58_026971 [Brassica napus]